MTTLQEHRDFYARLIVGRSGPSKERLMHAFARVERERYLSAGPWVVFTGSEYIRTVSDDPRLLYQDILIGLAADRGINNGQPSLHATCIGAAHPAEGESVVHVGAGTGYYTAVLAELVGPTGHVFAFEIDSDLAARARANLSHLRNVTVVAESAVSGPLPTASVVYVNAGATHPVGSWLDALAFDGRLIFPLTPDEGAGCMLLITRRAEGKYSARAISSAMFVPCVGARDKTTAKALATAFEAQPVWSVRSLHRNSEPDHTAWCVGSGWWLSTADHAGGA